MFVGKTSLRKVLLILASFVAMLLFIFATQVSAQQFDPLSDACKQAQENGESPPSCTSENTEPDLNPIATTIGKVTNIVAYVAGAVAVVMIVISGLRMITANGEAANIAKARTTIIYTVVGLAVIVAARTIILFVINRYYPN